MESDILYCIFYKVQEYNSDKHIDIKIEDRTEIAE
jgi:hypothetical protein